MIDDHLSWQDFWRLRYGIATGIAWAIPAIVYAQVLPDGTLPTIVDSVGQGTTNVVITGGTQIGGNLFHSFQEFSVPTGGAAIFDNPPDVANIISRVTGGNLSIIDGLLQTNGPANVFLLNPSGIEFGPNATLRIGGSLFASTAPGLQFADGTVFSAVNVGVAPLLTLSVPVGAQGISALEAQIISNGRLIVPRDLTLNTGTLVLTDDIQVGGNVTLQASNVLIDDAVVAAAIAPVVDTPANLTIQVAAQTVSLLNGGQLRIADSEVNDPTAIVVTAANQLVISGANSGIFSTARPSIGQDPIIQVTARTVGLLDGGQLRIADSGINSPTAIAVTATDQLVISGANSGIFSTTQAVSGQGGAVSLTSNIIQIFDGATVDTSTTGAATGGNISLFAPTVNITTGSKLQTSTGGTGQAGDITLGMATNPAGAITITDSGTRVQTATTADGASGNITLMGNLVTVANNASMGTSTTGVGNAGNITLAAQNQVTLQSGGLIASATSSDGASGLVTITAPRIAIDASQVFTSTTSRGNAGTITLSGGNQIDMTNNSQIRSQVSASAAPGQGGNIQITTPNLTVSRSLVSAETIGQGNSGTLVAQTQRLQLTEGGALQTFTDGSGDTGTLSIAATEGLTLTSQAQIRAIVGGGATGSSLPVQIMTPSLSLDGGAQVFSRVSGNATGGEMQIRAGTITLAGGSAIQSLVESEFGNGSEINLQADNLSMTNAAISSVNRGGQQGGQLAITTTGDIVLTGSQILTRTELGSGSGVTESQGGHVVVRGRSLQLNQGSQLATTITANGQGGMVDILTSEPIRLVGSEPDVPQTFITSETEGNSLRGTGGAIRLVAPTVELTSNATVRSITTSAGNGGDLEITTNLLNLTQGGQLRVAAAGAGNSGDIEIASRSRLIIADPNTGIFATTTPTATGNAGNITIHPDVALLRNEGTIAAISDGSGRGGNISLQGNSITLQNRAAIVTETASGQGGNIAIQLQDLLFLRDASLISATSPAAGSGSNLRFSGGYIIGFPSENSDIIATTAGGTGGTIQIASRGVFGFTPRTDSSVISDVISRVPLQVQGQAIVSTLGDDPSKGLTRLPDDVLDTSNQIVVGCPAEGGNKFTIPGRGGLLPNPSEIVNRLPTLIDWGDEQTTAFIQEGQGWEVSSLQPSPELSSIPDVPVDGGRLPQSLSLPEVSPTDQPVHLMGLSTNHSSTLADQWVRLRDGTVILAGHSSLQSWPLPSSCSSLTRSGP